MPHLFLTLQKDRNILAWQGQMQEFSIRGGGCTIVAILTQILHKKKLNFAKINRVGVHPLRPTP